MQDALTLSHPDKILWPAPRITKADLLQYYELVGDRLLPFVVNRPITLVRAPNGIGGRKFVQRHDMVGMSKLIDTVKVTGDRRPFLVIRRVETLAALAQIAAVEIHPWGATTKDIEHPDLLTFDLDPDSSVAFAKLRQAAFDLREILETLGMGAFLKLTGGRGLHVVCPLAPRAGWDEAREFARRLVDGMAGDNPGIYTTNSRKANRKGRIFLDYLRNGRSATAIAPWSPRARGAAPIALPIAWNMLDRMRELPRYSLNRPMTAFKAADAWADYHAVRRPLPGIAHLGTL